MPHVYQMSYPMLIMQRTSFTSIIVYLDVIVNPAEYHELWNDSGTLTERLEHLFTKVFIHTHLTVTVETTEKEQLLYMSDEIPAWILKHNVSSMNQSTLQKNFVC